MSTQQAAPMVAMPLPKAKKTMAMAGCCCLMLAMTFSGIAMNTILSPILSSMNAMQYVSLFSVFATLGVAIMTPVGAKLGDIVGRRNILVFAPLVCVICTIGMALLYESITYLVYDAQGLNMMSFTSLTYFGRMPGILIVLALAVAVFLIYCYLTVPGRRAKLLAGNQQASVNIGIEEKKNVLQTFFMCGILLGCAGAIFGSNNTVHPQASLSTAGTLFANIIPAYMGVFVGAVSIDALGVVLASLGMAILNYGLSCIGLGAGGWQQIIVGGFMLGFYTLTAQWPIWKAKWAKKQRMKTEGTVKP